jgi:hypothetical protein
LKNNVKGEYVLLLDGDDMLLEDCVELAMFLISRDKLDIVGGKYYILGTDGIIRDFPYESSTIYEQLSLNGEKLFFSILSNGMPFSVTGSLIRYSKLESIGFINSIFDLYHDKPLLLDLASSGAEFGYTDKYNHIYREGIGISTITLPGNKRLLRDHLKYTEIYLLPNNNSLDKKMVRKLYSKQKLLVSWDNIQNETVLKKLVFIILNFAVIARVFPYRKIKTHLNVLLRSIQ